MTTNAIPGAALDDRLGFVGTTGSGKTYSAGTCVERLLARGSRCIIIDPLDVWWGLRLLADGKTPSPYNVVIFGGAHADLPLNEHAGALIGEAAASMAESCIVSLGSLGTNASERRFVLAFLTAIYRKASGDPVHLIFDEADLWAPQRLLDKEGEAAKLLGQMETVVRRGRVKGLIPWLITQRPAVLSKNVLSQIDGLVAMKLTSSHDRDAIGDWVEGQADKEEWRRLWGNLPTMERGQGLVWIPARRILATSQFPTKTTFDSSAAAKRGEKKRAAELKPLNIDALKSRLATVEKEVVENDPRRLKAEVARLSRELSSAKAIPAADPAVLRKAEADGYANGVAACRAEMGKLFALAVTPLADRLKALPMEIAGAVGVSNLKPTPSRRLVAQSVEHRSLKATVVDSSPARRTNGHDAGARLASGERKILTVLAQYPDGRSARQVALLAGYAVSGGGFNNYLSALRSKGLIVGGKDQMKISNIGIDALGSFDPLPVGRPLLEYWYGQLGRAERACLEALAESYPQALTKDEVASRAGYEPNGGGFNNALSRLRTLELIEGRGELRAAHELLGS